MKSFATSAIALAVLSLLLGFAVHAVLLAGDYAQLPNLFRGEKDAQNYFPFMLAAHALIAIGMTWIYRQVACRASLGCRRACASASLGRLPCVSQPI